VRFFCRPAILEGKRSLVLGACTSRESRGTPCHQRNFETLSVTTKDRRIVSPWCYHRSRLVRRKATASSKTAAWNITVCLIAFSQLPIAAEKMHCLKVFACIRPVSDITQKQESRAVARKPCDAAAVLFVLKFADNMHYKFKSSQASKARLHSSKRRRNTEFSAKQGIF